MPSLAAITAAHSPVLVLDAASAHVQVGWLESADRGRWETSGAESGVAIFAGVERLGVDPGDAAAFVFCEGPGSILGIRTAAMAIRTWCVLRPRPVFCYQSLALVAHALGDPDGAVIADARRELWHHFQIGRGLRRVPGTELGGRLLTPEGFRHWSDLPAAVERTPYALEHLLERTRDADLLRATDAPDAFLHEEPSYVTWTPQVHRAPGT